MASLFDDLQPVLNEQEPARRFTDVSDEMKQKLCDPQTPFREWDNLSFDFLKEIAKYNQFFPQISRPADYLGRERYDPLWNCDKILDAALDQAAALHDIHSELHKRLLHRTWLNGQARCWPSLAELQYFITHLQSLLSLIKLLACAIILDRYRIPRRLNAVSKHIEDDFLHTNESDFLLLKRCVDRTYEIYLSLGPEDDEGIHELYHDSLYTAAKRCAILPSVIHTNDVQQTSTTLVAGGGFADVYKGEMDNGQVVALKVTRNFGTNDQIQKVHAEVCKEALVWNLSRHRNILPLLGVIATQGTSNTPGPIVLITPWMNRGSLKVYLSNNPGVDKKKMIKGVLNGVYYLHHHRTPPVVHGDLRCDNILVDDKGKPLIADFGLSRVEALQASLTGSSAARGSLRWQAPELLLPDTYGGNGKHTAETDVYAFGMTCFEILTGSIPFHELSEVQAMLAISQAKKPSRPDLNTAELPDEMWEMIERCWNSNRHIRPDASLLYFTWSSWSG